LALLPLHGGLPRAQQGHPPLNAAIRSMNNFAAEDDPFS
jgi:hypothetical protein